MAQATITKFGLQEGTTSTLYATWSWDKEKTENYQVKWQYDTGDGVWFVGSDSTTTNKQSTYSYPSNAINVRFSVKPLSKTATVNGKTGCYWTADWSTYRYYAVSSSPPLVPSGLSVTIKDYKLTATLSNLNVNATEIQFQIVKDDSTTFRTGTAKIVTNSATYSCSIDPGAEYKVRCRSVRGSLYSDWSDYSENQATKPAAPTGITLIRAESETSVYLEWTFVKSVTSYDLEYATKLEYFTKSSETTLISDIKTPQYLVTGLETGQQYFFRVRAVNDHGESPWSISGMKSIVLGMTPAVPTTWSSTTTAIVGEPLILYWVHNSEDGSTQKSAVVELEVNGVVSSHTVDTSKEEDDDKTMHYEIDTSSYEEGARIVWRVKTAGITGVYSEWSIQRTVDIYAPPTSSLVLMNNSGSEIDTLTSFPLRVRVTAGPNTQTPIGYHLSIVSNQAYETVDSIGNVQNVSAGEMIYSKHFDISTNLDTTLLANDVDFENNVSYTAHCTVSMNSGLTSESSKTFTVAWVDVEYEPNAEIYIDKDSVTASIRPYCEDRYGNLVSSVTLALYRREFDGKFTEIATGLVNTSNTYVTDPHPALDYARYRVVAVTDSTGAVSFYDIPAYPVGEKAIILQWNDAWSNFSVTDENLLEQPVWSGSLLRLPYNVDVSDSHKTDVSLVEYIGRENPVSYYGTQVGMTSTWNTVIDRNDEETLYALRRLANWMGDVYVREPSGSGYWANVSVSFSQKHREVTIPVTLSITRVSGGM